VQDEYEWTSDRFQTRSKRPRSLFVLIDLDGMDDMQPQLTEASAEESDVLSPASVLPGAGSPACSPGQGSEYPVYFAMDLRIQVRSVGGQPLADKLQKTLILPRR